MLKNILKRYDILLLVLLFLFSAIAEYHEIFSLLEDQTVSFRHGIRSVFGTKENTRFPLDRISLVTIDDRFYDEYGKFPLRRSDLAEIIRNVNDLGAKVICLDLLLDLPDACGEDDLLAVSVKESRAVLASRALFDNENRFQDISYPIPILRESGSSGYINLTSPSSSATFLSRLRIWPDIIEKKDGWPIAVQVVSAYLDIRPLLKGKELVLGDISVPLDHFNDIYIDFSPVPEGYRFLHRFAGIPASEFLNMSGLKPFEISELQMWIQDRIVIIGETTAISHDWFDTPVGMIYGSEIIADTVATLLRGAPLRPATVFAETAVSFLFFSLIVFCTARIRNLFLQWMSAMFLFAFYIFFCTALYVYQGTVFSMGYNLMTGICGYTILSFFAHSKEKKLSQLRRMEKEQSDRKRQAAEAANQAKSTFLANMSHELRTPLHAILGFTQVMEKNPDFPGIHREHLGIISNSGTHLLSLINQILDLSKAEAGRMSLHERDFDLWKLLKEVENMLRIKAGGKGLQLLFEQSPDLPFHIRTDRTRLQQILINLVDNAIKFTEEGSVWVRTLAENIPEEEGKHCLIRFEVEDTGPGIAEDEKEMLFNAFVQTETGRKLQEGTGLGLAISRQFIRLMGGELTLISPCCGAGTVRGKSKDRSEKGKNGALFVFSISVRIPDTVPEQRMPQADRSADAEISGKNDPAALHSGSLALLPPELPVRLKQVINELDDDRISEVIGDIRKHAPSLSEELLALARQFRYEEILQIISEVSGE